jgi:Cd2+/Zn2+-exporting ATPase
MEKQYRLKGLDCANCAAKIEQNVATINGVDHASVDFMKQKMTITSHTDFQPIEQASVALIHQLEPEVTVEEIKAGQTAEPEEEDHGKSDVIKMLIVFIGLVALHFLHLPTPVEVILYLVLYVLVGFEVIKTAVTNILHGEVFDENFLMGVATIGAFAIGEYPEAVAVMLFYQIGEYFQGMAVQQSRRSISALLAIRPEFANVERNGNLTQVDPEEVHVQEVIVVQPGERVPLDGVILSGSTSVDTSALTGESAPKSLTVGADILSGFINQGGLVKVRVTKSFSQSTVTKILDLVENASAKKAPAENFITKFARYYTPVVVGLAILLAFVPPLVSSIAFNDSLYRALTFLVISCPCALVISVPLSFFGGIGGASKLGILVKGSNYLEALSKIDTVVFDKTGTLTKGNFAVTQMVPADFAQADFLKLTASAEQHSTHPIAQSILAYYGKPVAPVTAVQEIAGFGIQAEISGREILVGNHKLLAKENIASPEITTPGTIIYVAIDRQFAGYLVINDEVKPDSQQAVRALHAAHVNTVMLTGDNQTTAAAVATTLGISEVHAELLPQDKVATLEQLIETGHKVAFVGDGINDAPVLARANVGIAMGALGSDAAIEAADVVLMDDAPSKLVSAIKLAKRTLGIVKQNITFALAVKFVVLILGAVGVASMSLAVFADVGVTLIAVLNAMRCLRVKQFRGN